MYDVIKTKDSLRLVKKTGDGLLGITPDVAEINNMRRDGLIGDNAIQEFVQLQDEIKKRQATNAI